MTEKGGVAVNLRNVSKFYKLYDSPKDRLKEALHPFKKKYHREFYALRNIDLQIRRGEILGIVGQNGSGKSTLLKLISGVIQPSIGKVVVKGAISALLELGAGMNPEFSGIQNIYFSGTMMGFSRKEMDEKVDNIVSFSDIGTFIHQPLKTYSSGMRTRLGFALAINMDPEILILDEVLAVGDTLFRRKCYTKMEQFFRSGCTVLYVSHSANSINEICTRAILMDKGEQILSGPPKLVTMHYQKYLFTPAEGREQVRKHIIHLDRDEEMKNKFASLPDGNGDGPAGKQERKWDRLDEEKPAPEPKPEPKPVPNEQAYYVPEFKPVTTLITRNYDVDIEDIRIRTLEGRNVNVLVMGEEYVYSYSVHFHIEAVHVGGGFPLKNEKGLVISNAHIVGDYIDKVEKGSKYLFECRFKCILAPGNYYTNAAVGAEIDGERKVLNRIVDALAFKVQPSEGKKFGGLVYCNQSIEIKEI